MNRSAWLALAALGTLSTAASAQSTVTVYGRVGVSLAQQADAEERKEVRNDMGSRLGVRGTEDLGGGLKAFFDLQHRLNTDTGTQGNAERFWEGKSVVGLQSSWGAISLGREQNPAYTFAQEPADPWGTYTVAANSSLINGRIGTTRYSNSINYAGKFGAFGFGAQIAQAEGNPGGDEAGADRPFSLGGGWASGPFKIGVGYEDPANENDHWASVLASYDFGVVAVGAFFGDGRNADDEKHRAYMLSLTAPVGPGEVRASWGQLKNRTTDVVRDEQFALGYNYKLSKRTSVFVTVAHENRDNMPSNFEKTGYDVGLRHDF